MNVVIFTDINGTYGFSRNLGAYTIASKLREYNLTVQVIDFFASVTLEDLQLIIDKFVDNDTFAVAFSTSYFKENKNINSYVEARNRWLQCDSIPQGKEWLSKLIELFLNKNSNIKFIIGGTQARRTTQRLEGIDHWVIGESENIVDVIKDIPHKIIVNLKYKDFYKSKMRWHKSDILLEDECLPIEFERGCPFNCSFCALDRPGSPSVKDVEVVKDELLYNYENFGITKYMIADLTFTSSRKKIERFCNMFLSLPFKIEWLAMGNLFIFNKFPHLREVFLESGCSSMFFGVESLNDETLLTINKLLTSEQMKDTLYSLREKWVNKIHMFASFIVGLPFETENSICETVEWLKNSPLDSYLMSRYYIQTEYSQYKNFSYIERNLNKYGYRIVDGKWVNDITGMSEDASNEIVRGVGGCNIYSYYMMRMKNLGYSYQDVWNVSMDYKESFVDSEKRKEGVRQKYMGELLR